MENSGVIDLLKNDRYEGKCPRVLILLDHCNLLQIVVIES